MEQSAVAAAEKMLRAISYTAKEAADMDCLQSKGLLPRMPLVPNAQLHHVLRGSMDGMDPTVITEIADYYKNEIGYRVPPMQPFVGRSFNVTRAGIHADGLMKDEKIYNIFDTGKLLNRRPSVMIGKSSGLAGIAYWINDNYDLPASKAVGKHDKLVEDLKTWIDAEYEGGRQTSLSVSELEAKIEEYSGGALKRL
jgi:isopropylmalate/homocitrate/citramalate synthase